MNVFIDSSAFLALLNEGDYNHSIAGKEWKRLLSDDFDLWTSNYVVLESTATIQRRFGISAVRTFLLDLLADTFVNMVSPEIHEAGISALLIAHRRDLSLIDCISFEMMRSRGIQTAFTFDPHFAEQGFDCLPAR